MQISGTTSVGAEVLRVLKPLGIDAAVKALEAQTSEMSAARRQLDLGLAQARYEAAHARRQYDAVDPANRLVAGELERRWNEALQAVHRIENEIGALDAKKSPPLGEKERQHLMQLGADLERAWSHPAASAATRKRILRAALREIIARIDNGFIDMVLHWQGGDHTALKLKMNTAGKHRWTVAEDTLTLVRELARQMPDKQIALLLNRAGKPTGRGNGWTEVRVRSFRHHHEIGVYRLGEWIDLGINVTPSNRETDWDYASGMQSAAKIEKDKVVMAIKINWKALGKTPKAGDIWLGNLFRCVGKDPTRGYLSWQATMTKEPSFHVPSKFGEFEFVK